MPLAALRAWTLQTRVSLNGPGFLNARKVLDSFDGRSVFARSMRWTAADSHTPLSPPSPMTGVIVGFARNGWPSVRLSQEAAQHARSASVVVAEPSLPDGTLLMRGQRLKLAISGEGLDGNERDTSWRAIAVLTETGPKKKKCIHPTRVAALCSNCPRRTKKRITTLHESGACAPFSLNSVLSKHSRFCIETLSQCL